MQIPLLSLSLLLLSFQLQPLSIGGVKDAISSDKEKDAIVTLHQQPLNILLLYADDWRHDTLSAAEGSKVIRTPFLDSLAKQGVRFRYNCVTTSICWISRATLVTGQFYSRHRQAVIQPPIYFYDYWNETYPGLLKDHGYYLGHVGKWQLANIPSDKYDFSRVYHGKHWIPAPNRTDGRVHVTKKNEEDSLEFLKSRPRDKPFCLTVAFFAPHAEDSSLEQYKPQPNSMSLYVNASVPLAPSATQDAWEAMPDFFTETNEGRKRWHWRFDTRWKYQRMMKNYFRMVTEVDSTCRAIVQELKNQGVLNNTLVIFTSDNGYFHSEHGLADKFFPHQESIRVPLIIRDPRMPAEKVGTTNDDFTLSIDLATTILSAAGISPPARMQGRDISELYRRELATHLDANPWRKEFYYEFPLLFPKSEALVRKDFKLINWMYRKQENQGNNQEPMFDLKNATNDLELFSALGMQEQLFDLKNDPWELKDVINRTENQELLREMRGRLQEWREAVK